MSYSYVANFTLVPASRTDEDQWKQNLLSEYINDDDLSENKISGDDLSFNDSHDNLISEEIQSKETLNLLTHPEVSYPSYQFFQHAILNWTKAQGYDLIVNISSYSDSKIVRRAVFCGRAGTPRFRQNLDTEKRQKRTSHKINCSVRIHAHAEDHAFPEGS